MKIRFLIMFIFGITGLTLLFYNTSRIYVEHELKSDLNLVRTNIFLELQKEFKTILLKKTNKNLKFLGNIEFFKTKNINKDSKTTQENGILKITLPNEILFFSLNELEYKIKTLLSSKIDFNLQQGKELYLKQTIELLPNHLSISYGVDQLHVQEIRKKLIIEAFIFAITITAISTVIGHYFFKRLENEDRIKLYQELLFLRKVNEDISVENSMMKLEKILFNSSINQDKKLIEFEDVLIAMSEYLRTKNVDFIFESLNTEMLKTVLRKSDLYYIIISLLFYRFLLSSKTIKMLFDIKEEFISVVIRDDGFKIETDKIINYTRDLEKPDFVLGWLNIVAILTENKICLTNDSDINFHYIKINVPLEKNENNICFFKDYRL